ncbi:MAG: methylase of chemotaxis methyl-accepting protein [Paenibacillaceae bacterium]|nr:methylase of chemotaxis methyl-accepting protein [Paenibacillaceae bacterium]
MMENQLNFPGPIEEVETRLLLEGIYQIYGYDFRQYSIASVTRRILYRMRSEGLRSISALQERLLRDPGLWKKLFNDICIPVTEMFRDPYFFESIRLNIVPELRKLNKIHIWHAGCSTGEEVYSLAILLKEEQLYDRCTIYATDLNEDWLARAKEGVYQVDRMQSNTRNYILSGGYQPFSNYYTVTNQQAVIEPELRRNITFFRHNLAGDQSFHEFHLILCRNVLIYFQPALQQTVMGLFRKSLSLGGFLALGSKEALSPFKDRENREWEPFIGHHRIYRYKGQQED